MAGPLLENEYMNNPIAQIADAAESMIDAKQAASSLRLPYYWFADQKMRAKFRIPHYLLGGLVRFRMSELAAWAAESSAVQSKTAGGTE